jgi:hypothetical protein
MIYVRGKKGILDSAQFIHEVWALRYRKGELSRKYAGPNTIVGHTHALPTLIVPVRFYEELCQTLNASKSVRNWTPNRAEVDSACLPYHVLVLFLARTLWTPKSRVWTLRYRNAGLSRKYAGPITTVGHTHALPALIVPVRFYEELVKR